MSVFLEHEATVSSEAFSTARPSQKINSGGSKDGVFSGNRNFTEFTSGMGDVSPVGSTSILEFPLNVASDDIASGNHGHYIMFYINEQEKARLSIGNRTGGGSIAENAAEAYNIAGFIRNYKSQFSRYENQKNGGVIEQLVNADDQQFAATALRGGATETQLKTAQIQRNLRKGQKAGGSTVRVARKPTKRLDTAIALYMPQSVQVTYGAQYTDTQIGAVTEEALNVFNNIAAGRGGDDLKNQLTTMGKNVADSLQNFLLASVGIIPGLQGARETAEMKSGNVIADRLELAFKGINKRNFQYTFKMTPKDRKEVDMIRKIIFAFKANMMPEFVGDNRGGRKLLVPNTFDIAYMYLGSQNLHLHNISTCVLENMNVVYGGDRYKTFEPDAEGAQPVETTITLNFKEMELITRERVFEGY